MKPLPSQVVPPPRATDSEDVRWGLSTAAALWTSGERHDALKWLRRAADAARHLDDDRRAVELLHAFTWLASTLEVSRETVAPTAPPVRASTVPRPLAPPPPPNRRRAAEPPRALPPPPRTVSRPSLPMVRVPSQMRVAVHIRHGVARLQLLEAGVPAPEGAALALLVPVGRSDADALSAWSLTCERVRGAVRSMPEDRGPMHADAACG